MNYCGFVQATFTHILLGCFTDTRAIILLLQGLTVASIRVNELERLRSEDTPRRLIITQTIESCWIPSQNKI